MLISPRVDRLLWTRSPGSAHEMSATQRDSHTLAPEPRSWPVAAMLGGGLVLTAGWVALLAVLILKAVPH